MQGQPSKLNRFPYKGMNDCNAAGAVVDEVLWGGYFQLRTRQGVEVVPASLTMKIFVDESGNFLTAQKADTWSTIVAYASPETDRRSLDRLVGGLRAECSNGAEAKLRDISESRFPNSLSISLDYEALLLR